jgi:benzoyl-CoA reductase/2-hydroxyglutaryl-CoA dehydratase subunit BcrC/BadD/HgdB
MDAVCAASALVGLLFNCATAVKQCNDLRGHYKAADRTLRSIATEASTLRTSTHQLQHLMQRDPAALSSRWDFESMLPQTFEAAIQAFNGVLDALLRELEKFKSSSSDMARQFSESTLTRGLKIKLLWNESTMQDLLIQLRAQQQSLHFLLNVLHMYDTVL